jgi:hypothetical protein
MQVGGEFFVRHVPQSRYFQYQELDIKGLVFDPPLLRELNRQRKMKIIRRVFKGGIELTIPGLPNPPEWE